MPSKSESLKTHSLTFEPKQYQLVNNVPLENYGETVQEIALYNPSLACTFLRWALVAYEGHIMPDVQVQTRVGVISSTMDGDTIARGAFLQVIEHTLTGGAALEPIDIVLSSFKNYQRLGTDLQERIAMPAFTINMEPPALAC
jgi:hypothetical protein